MFNDVTSQAAHEFSPDGIDLLLAEFLVKRNLALAAKINMDHGAFRGGKKEAAVIGTTRIHACVLGPITIPLIKSETELTLEAGVVVIRRKNLIKFLRLDIEQANRSIVRGTDQGRTSTVPL